MRIFHSSRTAFLGGLTIGIFATLLTLTALVLMMTRVFPPLEKLDSGLYQPDIRLHNPEEVEVARIRLTRFIFNQDRLPDTLPKVMEEGLLVHMQNGFISKITILKPVDNALTNGALVLYHCGHEGETFRDRSMIRRLLKAGYLVWKLDMPLIGENAEPVEVQLPQIGPVLLRSHEQMAYLDEITDGSPIRYFIEPVIAAINQAEMREVQPVFMVGLSGGGWTTVLSAALDTRIRASYPVAASLPMGLRFDRPRKNWGTWEETLPELYHLASYEDLYIMGAQGRSQLQVLNQYDLCCYDDPRYHLYETAVQQALLEIGGEFSVWWSQGEFIHWTNPSAAKRILEDMAIRCPHGISPEQ